MIFFIFEPYFGFTHSMSGVGDEKGIRCNTGAVPAAVSPLKVSDSSATICQLTDGKVQKTGQARRPAVIHYIFFAFGKISKNELHIIVIHFSMFNRKSATDRKRFLSLKGLSMLLVYVRGTIEFSLPAVPLI